MEVDINVDRNWMEKLKRYLVLYIGMFLSINQQEISADVVCGRPGRTLNTRHEPAGQNFNIGDIIRYNCTEEDYFILGVQTRQCLRNGSWSNEMPVCYKLVKISGAQQSDNDPEMGAIFSIDGNVTTCSRSTENSQTVWEGYLLFSTNISAVRIIIEGKRDVNLEVTVSYDDTSARRCLKKSEGTEDSGKTTIIVYCPTGTVGKYIHIRCRTQALNICEVSAFLPPKQQCLAPDIPLHGNGHMISSGIKSEYRFNCHSGYKRWGTLSVHCQEDGTWSPTSPVCQEIYCSPPNKPENGNVRYDLVNGKVPFNGTATYSCNEGFYLKGKTTIRCHRWEEWDFLTPKCKERIMETTTDSKELRCGRLPHIANGAFMINSSDVGSIAWLKCNEGFKPLTKDHITCLPSGEWNPQSLLCTIIQCEINPIVPHGTSVLLNNSSYYGSQLQIKCNQGYTSHEPILRRCEESGTWENLNVCVEISCGIFASNEEINGEWIPLNKSSSVRILICPEGFHIDGSPPFTECLSNGSWSYTSATCKKTDSNSADAWGSNWSPTLMLIVAIAAGAGTAVLVLCFSIIFLVIKKRRQLRTNTTVFHFENACQKKGAELKFNREKHRSASETYEGVELRQKSGSSNSRKPRSALPNLPIDADPVYAQPFEMKKISTSTVNRKDDFYSAHIYAEPVDSRNEASDSNNMPANVCLPRSGTETRLPTIKTNLRNKTTATQQNCHKQCAIYDSSSNSECAIYDSSNRNLAVDENFEKNNEKITLNRNTNKSEYLELL